MLRCVIVRTVKLVNIIEMCKTLERQDLSRMYLAHHELESVITIINVISHKSIASKQIVIGSNQNETAVAFIVRDTHHPS
jgi:hypothetical protein